MCLAQDDLREAARLDVEGKCGQAEQLYRNALKQGAPSPALLNNLGNHYIACGQADQAAASFERLLKSRPAHENANLQMARIAADRKDGRRALLYLAHVKNSDPTVRLLRAEALYLAGKFADAEDGLSELLQAAPDDYTLLFHLGRAAARAQHYDRAQHALEAALKLRPDDVDAALELALVHAAKQDFARAVFLLAQARQHEPKRPDVLLALARSSEAAGYYGDATLAYDEYLALRPDDDDARRDRALVYGLTGTAQKPTSEEAAKQLREHLRKHPSDPMAYFFLAQLCWAADPRSALEHLSTALRLDPELVPARFARAWLLYRSGRASESLPDLERVAARERGSTRVLTQLGLVFLTLSRPLEAEKTLRQALAISPDDPQVLLPLGRSLLALGRESESEPILNKYQRFRSRGVRGPRREAGMIELATLSPVQRSEHEIERLRQQAAAHPGDPDLQLTLGKLLIADGRFQDANAALSELLSRDAESRILFEAGTALVQAGQYALAKKFLERAIIERPEARLDLAMAVLFTDGAKAALTILGEVPESQRSGDYLLIKARLLDADGQALEAVKVLEESRDQTVSRPQVARQGALLLLRHDRKRQALNLLDRALRSTPNDPDLLLTRAIALGVDESGPLTDRAFQQIESRFPEWDRAYLVHGVWLQRVGRSLEAKQKFRTAAALGAGAEAQCAFEGAPASPCDCRGEDYDLLFPHCAAPH